MKTNYELKNASKIKLYWKGNRAFEQIIERINSSQKSIYINMFIWRDDIIGNIIAKEVLNAANRGVRIHISKDKLGSIFEKAEENKQSFFHKEFNFLLWVKQKVLDKTYPSENKSKNCKQNSNDFIKQITNHKNIIVESNKIKNDHSKFYLFDNKVLILGGINIEDRGIFTDCNGKCFSDYMVEIDEQIVVDIFKDRYFHNKFFDSNSDLNFIINNRVFGTKTFEIKEFMINLLRNSRRKVYILMAYFGDKDITNIIIHLINNGIEVIIMTSLESNVQNDLNIKTLKQIYEKTSGMANIYLSEYMVHSKLIYVDEMNLFIGSSNMTKTSMYKHSELNLFLKNPNKLVLDVLEKSISEQELKSYKVNDISQLKFSNLKAFFENLI